MIKTAKARCDEIKSKIDPAVKTFDAINEEVNKLKKTQQDRIEDAKIEEEKVELVRQHVDGVRNKRNEIINKYYEAEDKYMEQQRLIKKINWMAQQKERAIKQAEWERQKEEEEKAKIPINPQPV